MSEPTDCYLCGKLIDENQESVSIPRLGLKLHLGCYERDLRSGNPSRVFHSLRPTTSSTSSGAS
jgi:hypothetical protein